MKPRVSSWKCHGIKIQAFDNGWNHIFSHGGWVLDNFPNTRDQWNQCIEKNMMPDDVIVLKDKGENSNYLLKRWYNMNREDVDAQIRKRVEEEEERRRAAEEERR